MEDGIGLQSQPLLNGTGGGVLSMLWRRHLWRFSGNGSMKKQVTTLHQIQLEFPFEALLAHRLGL